MAQIAVIKHPLRIAGMDVAVGRNADLKGRSREGPESAP